MREFHVASEKRKREKSRLWCGWRTDLVHGTKRALCNHLVQTVDLVWVLTLCVCVCVHVQVCCVRACHRWCQSNAVKLLLSVNAGDRPCGCTARDTPSCLCSLNAAAQVFAYVRLAKHVSGTAPSQGECARKTGKKKKRKGERSDNTHGKGKWGKKPATPQVVVFSLFPLHTLATHFACGDTASVPSE